ncbi:MAG: 16S rRNA (guanine(527)-N(7))-methyltransferase RsmG [Acetobacteraceae bacterium]|nr:16S rRNA (guanine(527)-N(7))-methyltransferase RsmG [Acetobacteraceae bacterium]
MKHATPAQFGVSRETTAKLDILAALILTWNRTINLVSRNDEAHLLQRHIADSLALLPHLPPSFNRAIDLGSGAGFPGLVLALATGRHFDLIEADQRKAAFLREAARATGAPATIHASRIETTTLPPAPLVTARALAPLPQLLSWASPLLSPGGVCVFPKGRTVQHELTQAATQWHMRVEQWPNPLDPSARILRLSEILRG